MRFTADRAQLAETVKWVAGAISPKPSQPALAGLYVATTPDGVVLAAHNYDQVHSATLAADVETHGLCVPTGLMVRDLLGALRTKAVTVEADERRLTIKGGRSVYGVNLFAGWPEFPTGDAVHRGVVQADDLRAAIALASAAADDDSAFQEIAGVRLEVTELDGALSLVGFQSSRLCVGQAPFSGDPFAARLPIKNLSEAARGLSGGVSIASSDGILTLADASRSVTLRLYESAKYPAYGRNLVRREDALKVTVDADELTAAVRRAALAGGKESTLVITVSNGELTILGNGDEADGSEVIDVEGEGSFTGSWGADVLGKVLSTLPSTPVVLTFEQTNNGGFVLAITDKAGSFDHVVMGKKAQS